MNILNFLLTNLINATMAGLLLGLAFWIFKLVVFGNEFHEVMKEKGVSGGAIVLSAFLIAMGLVLGLASF